MSDLKKYGHKYVSYAQNLEDVRLYGYLSGLDVHGFYVDIGANHPIEDSVTKFFYIRGWHGINIEPHDYLIKLLKTDRPRDINLNIGIANKKGTMSLRKYSSHGLSTFYKKLQVNYEVSKYTKTKDYTDIVVPVDTLSNILQVQAKDRDIHFMKIDVEGFEYQVIKSNDWKKFRPWVICIESTGLDRRWKDVLLKAGYTLHIFDGLNEYYVAEEKADLITDYHAIMASEVIRFDIANQLTMRILNMLRVLKSKTTKSA